MQEIIKVTGRMKAFTKIPSGKLRLLKKVVEPLEDGTPLKLIVMSEPEIREFKKEKLRVVMVRKYGHVAGNTFYIRLDEIDAADHNQELQRRYVGRGRLRVAS